MAKKHDLNLYVCSEEDPSINNCRNCCGTDKYRAFDSHNTAAANNIYKTLEEEGEITLDEIKNQLWSIHRAEFEKRWDRGDVADFLVNASIKEEDGKEIRDSKGHLVYTSTGD